MTEYTFDERGLPTLARSWDGTVPTVPPFPPNDSGRRARGELECICDMLCKRWMVNAAGPMYCSAEWLAHEATKYDGRPTTSAATGRVLERWAAVGYAVMDRKPIRFVRLTAEGVEIGLSELYRREKRKVKRYKASVYRGEKPPVQ
jgi:hypothetical protein